MSLFSRKAYDKLIAMTGKKGEVPMLVGELWLFLTDRVQYQGKSAMFFCARVHERALITP